MHYKYRKVKILAQKLKDELLISVFYWRLYCVILQKSLPCRKKTETAHFQKWLVGSSLAKCAEH